MLHISKIRWESTEYFNEYNFAKITIFIYKPWVGRKIFSFVLNRSRINTLGQTWVACCILEGALIFSVDECKFIWIPLPQPSSCNKIDWDEFWSNSAVFKTYSMKLRKKINYLTRCYRRCQDLFNDSQNVELWIKIAINLIMVTNRKTNTSNNY